MIAETLTLLEDDLFYAGTLYLRLATKHLFPIGSKMAPCGHKIWPTSILIPHCTSFENVAKCLQLFGEKFWCEFIFLSPFVKIPDSDIDCYVEKVSKDSIYFFQFALGLQNFLTSKQNLRTIIEQLSKVLK